MKRPPFQPEFICEFYPLGLVLKAAPGAGGIPCNAINTVLPLCRKDSVMDPGLANALDAIVVIGQPRQLEEWRQQVEAAMVEMFPDPVTRWLHGTDTGDSSAAIVFALTGQHRHGRAPTGDTPRDASDFGRCVRLLARFPAWRARLPEVAARWPNGRWPNLVSRWDELETAFKTNPSHVYDLLKTL